MKFEVESGFRIDETEVSKAKKPLGNPNKFLFVPVRRSSYEILELTRQYPEIPYKSLS